MPLGPVRAAGLYLAMVRSDHDRAWRLADSAFNGPPSSPFGERAEHIVSPQNLASVHAEAFFMPNAVP